MISQAIRTTFSIHSAVFVRSGLTVSRLWGSVKVRFGFDLNLRWKNFEFDPTILRANSTQPPFSHPLSSCLQFFHLPLPFFHSSIFHSPSSLPPSSFPPSSIPPLPFPPLPYPFFRCRIASSARRSFSSSASWLWSD